jgi:hypothetical protein
MRHHHRSRAADSPGASVAPCPHGPVPGPPSCRWHRDPPPATTVLAYRTARADTHELLAMRGLVPEPRSKP